LLNWFGQGEKWRRWPGSPRACSRGEEKQRS
jgi:hypothetical protein